MDRTFRGYYDELRATGVVPSIARCYARSARKQDPEPIQELASGTASNAAVIRMQERLKEKCVPDGMQIVESNRTDAQLRKTRQLLKDTMEPLLERKGATEAQIGCVNDEIDALSSAEFEEITSGQEGSSAEAIMNQIFEACRRAR